MKPTTLLLSASLVANIALVGVVATRSPESASDRPSTSAAPASARLSSADSEALRTALASGDLAALKAAGLPADVARDLALGKALAKFQQKMQASRTATSGDGRWWRNRNAAKNREDELLARRELSAALLTALGDDLGMGGADNTQLAFLSAEKRAKLRGITQDYDEMMAKFGASGVQLASDKEKVRLLKAERDRDIAALLTPDELADYELRTSPASATLRSRYGDAIESEEDFRKLYALQKAFDDKFPTDALMGRVTPEAMRARSDAQQQLQSDIRSALGDDKYAALRRASDPELKTLDSLVSRVGLPTNTTDKVAASRETYATESQRINADTSLTPAQRRTQIQDLGNRAKTELSSTLGSEVADAYAPRASWVGMMQNGMAFSTTPVANSPGALSLGGVGPSVYPIIPAGAVTSTPGGTRQTVNFVSATSDTAAPSGAVLFSGSPSEPVTRNVQMISIGSSSTPTETTATHTTTPAPTPAPKP